jgi:hypothetical protein
MFARSAASIDDITKASAGRTGVCKSLDQPEPELFIDENKQALGRGARNVRALSRADRWTSRQARRTALTLTRNGTMTEQRLYQLILQPKPIADRQFEIEFFGSGVEAFAFTFG